MDKKMYRSETNRMIAGVCGGLAETFEIDATIVRLIMLVLVLGGGSGLLIYIVLVLIMPVRTEKAEIREPKERKVKTKGNWPGLVLVAVGILALWNQIMPIQLRGEIVWPVALIGLGAWIVLR